MIIDYKNENLIEEKNIHDSIFEGFMYNEETKVLLIELKNFVQHKQFKLEFVNVLVLNCELCQFWGKGPNILDWEIANPKYLTQNIIDKQSDDKMLYNNSLVDVEKNYIETIITLTSGDTIAIVCEYIEFIETIL